MPLQSSSTPPSPPRNNGVDPGDTDTGSIITTTHVHSSRMLPHGPSPLVTTFTLKTDQRTNVTTVETTTNRVADCELPLDSTTNDAAVQPLPLPLPLSPPPPLHALTSDEVDTEVALHHLDADVASSSFGTISNQSGDPVETVPEVLNLMDFLVVGRDGATQLENLEALFKSADRFYEECEIVSPVDMRALIASLPIVRDVPLGLACVVEGAAPPSIDTSPSASPIKKARGPLPEDPTLSVHAQYDSGETSVHVHTCTARYARVSLIGNATDTTDPLVVKREEAKIKAGEWGDGSPSSAAFRGSMTCIFYLPNRVKTVFVRMAINTPHARFLYEGDNGFIMADLFNVHIYAFEANSGIVHFQIPLDDYSPWYDSGHITLVDVAGENAVVPHACVWNSKDQNPMVKHIVGKFGQTDPVLIFTINLRRKAPLDYLRLSHVHLTENSTRYMCLDQQGEIVSMRCIDGVVSEDNVCTVDGIVAVKILQDRYRSACFVFLFADGSLFFADLDAKAKAIVGRPSNCEDILDLCGGVLLVRLEKGVLATVRPGVDTNLSMVGKLPEHVTTSASASNPPTAIIVDTALYTKLLGVQIGELFHGDYMTHSVDMRDVSNLLKSSVEEAVVMAEKQQQTATYNKLLRTRVIEQGKSISDLRRDNTELLAKVEDQKGQLVAYGIIRTSAHAYDVKIAERDGTITTLHKELKATKKKHAAEIKALSGRLEEGTASSNTAALDALNARVDELVATVERQAIAIKDALEDVRVADEKAAAAQEASCVKDTTIADLQNSLADARKTAKTAATKHKQAIDALAENHRQSCANLSKTSTATLKSTEEKLKSTEKKLKSAEEKLKSAEEKLKSAEEKLKSAEEKLKSAEETHSTTLATLSETHKRALAQLVTAPEKKHVVVVPEPVLAPVPITATRPTPAPPAAPKARRKVIGNTVVVPPLPVGMSGAEPTPEMFRYQENILRLEGQCAVLKSVNDQVRAGYERQVRDLKETIHRLEARPMTPYDGVVSFLTEELKRARLEADGAKKHVQMLCAEKADNIDSIHNSRQLYAMLHDRIRRVAFARKDLKFEGIDVAQFDAELRAIIRAVGSDVEF